MKVEVANRILPALSEYAVCEGERDVGRGGGLTFAASIFLFCFSCIYLHGTEDMYRVEIIIIIVTTTTTTHNHKIS